MVTVIGYLSTLFGTTFAFFTTARDLNHLIRRVGKSMKKNRKEERRRKKNFFQSWRTWTTALFCELIFVVVRVFRFRFEK